MHVILIGPAHDRARLRRALTGTSVSIAGEAENVGAARAAGLHADADLVATAPARVVHDDAFDDLAGPEALTPREMQVLELLAEGLPNKAIAARLEISDQTVKFHVAQICGKLGALNRTDAVRRAVQRGLIAL